MYVVFLPITSEREDQMKRPARLNRLSNPTKPAAAAAVTAGANIVWIIGDACDRTPIPAVTLQNNTIQSSQNCGVRMARSATTLPLVTNRLRILTGSGPMGLQSGAGTRTVKTPNIMKAR